MEGSNCELRMGRNLEKQFLSFDDFLFFKRGRAKLEESKGQKGKVPCLAGGGLL